MIFEKEKQLQQAIAKLDLGLVGESSYAVLKREVPIGGIVPDFILLLFDDNPNLIPNPIRWTFRHAFVVWLLRTQNCMSIEAIAKHCYETVERIYPVTNDLIESQVIKVEDNNLSLSETFVVLKGEIIAIEAKLFRWREAFAQAVDYKRFAQRTIVAMDSSRVPRDSEILDEFEKNNVGLCAISENSIEWLVKATSSMDTWSPDSEYLSVSGSVSKNHTSWSLLKPTKASSQA